MKLPQFLTRLVSSKDRDGLEMLSELSNRYPTISVVVLSARQDRDTVMRVLDLGALGFIPKSGERGVMLSAFSIAASPP